jgi:hypothetical protein
MNRAQILVVKLEGKRQIGSPRRRWEDNIKMDFLWKQGSEMRIGFIWLSIGVGGGLLRPRS